MATSTSSFWQRLESLFRQAASLPAPQRAPFVSDACGDDSALRARLEEMLAAHDRAGLLDAGPVSDAPPPTSARTHMLIGRQVGQFTILRLIDSGGMGIVYEAQQSNPRRSVALKVLHPHLLYPDAMRRFTFEAEALGRLQHPSIAQIYEAGVFESDAGPQPFLAMELVHGLPLTEYAERRRLTLPQRLALMIRIAEGVDHAHRHDVVHRDLKPGNILVIDDARGAVAAAPDGSQRPVDAGPLTDPAEPLGGWSPQPKIVDFGIARATDQARRLTQSSAGAQLMGTLGYMSPEQVAGDSARVDHRSDVYALGVIAFELISGRPPHDLKRLSIAESARVITHDEPTRLGAVSRNLRGDLDSIVSKALEKDPDRRYQSAEQFADDLRRFLRDQPVLARPPSTLYQLRKFARRNKALVAATAAVFGALLLGVAGVAWQLQQAIVQRDLARDAELQARDRLDQTLHTTNTILGLIDKDLADIPGRMGLRLQLAEDAVAQLRTLPLVDPVISTLAYAHQRLGDVQLDTGRTADAHATFLESLAIRELDPGAGRDDPQVVRALAVAHWKIAEALVRMGRFVEALKLNQRSLAMHERVGTALNASAVYLAISHRRLAEVYAATGEHATALEHLRAAVVSFDEQSGVGPADTTLRRSLAMTWRAIGESLTAVGDLTEAQAALGRCATLIAQLEADAGEANVWERSQRVRLLLAQVRLHAAMNSTVDALTAARSAVHVASGLVAADAQDAVSRHLLARALLAQAAQLPHSDRSATVARAVSMLEQLHQIDPANWWIEQDLQSARKFADRESRPQS